MKTQKHTPGPWDFHTADNTIHPHATIDDASGKTIAYVSWTENVDANAARIVACVNACEGINPEAVPQLLNALSDFVESFRREIENDEEISGGDAVEYIANFYQDAIKAIAAATKEG